jgi:hypothetical protein
VTAAIVAAVIVILLAGVVIRVWRRRSPAPQRMTPSSKRILFPFLGDRVSKPVLDAALRVARFEAATLGRPARHALRRLFDHERFDRRVVPASESRARFSYAAPYIDLPTIPAGMTVSEYRINRPARKHGAIRRILGSRRR